MPLYQRERPVFFKLSANVHVVYSSLPNSRLLFVNKYKIYNPDFAHIKYCCFNSYFWLSVYHIVFIELAIAIIEALQCKKILYLVIIHVLCVIHQFLFVHDIDCCCCLYNCFFIWHIAGMNLSIWLTMTLLCDFWVELKRVCLFVEAGILIFEVHINEKIFKIVIYLWISHC